jgi:pSer/pThr/pTyr-binding forkhead associated (FHA) protein
MSEARFVVAKAPRGADDASAAGWTLLAVGSANEGSLTVIPLDKPEIVIGRGDDCDVHLRHATVSRRHARVWCTGGDYWVEDLGSSNGVRVNDAEVARHKLAPNDRVRIGKFVLVFTLS